MILLCSIAAFGLVIITAYDAFAGFAVLGFWRLAAHNILVMAWVVALVCAYARLAIMAARRKQCGR